MAEPLNDQDLEDINKSLAGLTTAAEIIKRAKAAGMDVDQAETDQKNLQTRLQGVKAQFFPGR